MAINFTKGMNSMVIVIDKTMVIYECMVIYTLNVTTHKISICFH